MNWPGVWIAVRHTSGVACSIQAKEVSRADFFMQAADSDSHLFSRFS
jgi:hypothetical protein